mgnify:CR=1 FL=1
MSILGYKEREAKFMGRMMQTVGVDFTQVSGLELDQALRKAAANCAGCQNLETCQHWLDQAAPGAEAPGFCPNAKTFDNWR